MAVSTEQLWVSLIRLTKYVDVYCDSISDGSSILPASTSFKRKWSPSFCSGGQVL